MTIGEKIPDTPTVYTEEELALQKELKRLRDVYVYVNTNFKRTSEPIFVLAIMECIRRLKVKDKLLFQTDDEIFKTISKTVRSHYKENNGKLNVWGDIINYNYHHYNGKQYVFDKNGNVIDDFVNETQATLSLKR